MAKSNRSSGPRYDTPTDGISRKQFDRAMDSHVRRYVALRTEFDDLRREVATVIAWLQKPPHSTEEE